MENRKTIGHAYNYKSTLWSIFLYSLYDKCKLCMPHMLKF